MKRGDLHVSRVTIVFICTLSAITWILAIRNTARDVSLEPGADLRNRVVGARRLMDGINPYLPIEVPLAPYYRSVTLTSISPAHLLFYSPLCSLPWNIQRWAYFSIDWIFVLAFTFVLSQMVRQWVPIWLTIAFVSVALLIDNSFELHFARGQIYLTLLLLTASAASGVLAKKAGLMSAIAIAITIIMRPTYAVMIVVLWVVKMNDLAKRALIAVFVLMLPTLAVTGINSWTNYMNVLWHAGSVHWAANRGQDPPHTIEGINFFLKGKPFHGWGVDRTFLGLFEFGPLHRLQIYHQQIQRLNALLLLGTLTATLYCLWRKRDSLRPLEIAVITTLCPIVLETFGPERYAYTDVLIALPLILVIAARVKERPSRWFSSVVLLAGYALLSRVPIPSLALLSVTRYWLALTILLTYVAITPKEESLPLEKPLPTTLPDPIIP